MNRAMALVVLFVISARVGLCQTIARDDIARFRCGLVLGSGEDERPVLVPRPAFWTIGDAEAPVRPDTPQGSARLVEMVYISTPAAAQPTDDGRLLFVPLQSSIKNQYQSYVLTVWAVAGDSISLVTVNSVARIGDPVGGLSLSAPRQSAPGEYMIFTGSMLGDTDLRWGDVDVLRYRTDVPALDRVYRATYSYCLTARSDTLEAQWRLRDGHDFLQLVRRDMAVVQDDAMGWTVFAVNAETTLVGIEELAEHR